MKLQYFNQIALLIALFATSFTVDANQQLNEPHLNVNTPHLGRHMDVDIQINEIPQLFKPVPVTVQVKNNLSALKQVTVELILPEGIIQTTTLKNKATELLPNQETISDQFSIKAVNPGQYKVTVIVSGYTTSGKFKDRYEYLYFTVDNNHTKSKMGFDKQTDFIDTDHKFTEMPQFDVDANGFVEVAAADENQNETTRLIPANEYYSNNQIQGGIVTISGNYRFRNREDTAYIGYYRNYLRLFNAATNEFLASTYTNEIGNFTFPSVTNTDSDGFKVHVYSVRFLTGGLGYGVCETDDCVDQAATSFSNLDQFYYRQSSVFTAADGNHNAGTFTTGHSLNNTARAMWIKNDMDEAYLHLSQHSSIRGPFTAEWAVDSTVGNFYNRDGNIHFKADVGDGTNHTILHEIGHNVMWNAGAFVANSDCPSPHFYNQISAFKCAWTEGWASAFTVLVNNNPNYCLPPSTSNCLNFDTDSSYDHCTDGWYCGSSSELVEGHVTGALWDIYDSQNDDFDIESYNIYKIYNILESDTNFSFSDWWTSWNNDGNSDLALNSIFQNDILFGDIYDVRVNNEAVSNASPQTFEEFSMSATIRNLGDISSIATNINYYLSTNNTISHFDDLLTTKYSGILDKNISRIITQTLSVNTPGNYWVGACFDDAYDFDEVSSNDCTNGVQITISSGDVIFKAGFDAN